MDEYEQADAERRRLLATYCLHCGQRSGWCVNEQDEPIRNVHRQHSDRYEAAGIRRGVLRALLVKAGLV
ncbi:hypothetical protein [Tenggerimyces flavus]|uniref:Uncharacterized protein n=1 Tax=Tenggerimyces flavus TaxID=1708749 RepID=A0ABV7YLL1_9ACTN|nr:hypothetical protein [Tenggerimyces flavus]MBM7784906.1 hypothetical protein [Tenggerimyces flavus]